MKFIFLLASVFLTPNQCFSAPPPTQSNQIATYLTLKEFIKRGITYSPDLQGAESKVRGAEDTTDKTIGALFPTLNAVASAVNRKNATALTGAGGANGDLYQAGLQLSQPLYAGGALTSGLNHSKASEEIAKQTYYSAKQTVAQTIIQTFYNLSQAELLLARAQENLAGLKAYLDITNRYNKIGRSKDTDFLQASVNFSLAKIDVSNSENNLRIAQQAAHRLLGFETGGPDSEAIKSSFEIVIPPTTDLTPEKALEAALERNPSIKSLEKALEQVSYAEDVDLSVDFPSLYLNASSGFASPDRSSLFDGTSKTHSIGLNLTIPIFSGLTSISKRRIYSEQRFQAEKSLQSARDNLRAGIEGALSTLKSLQTQLEFARSSVKQGGSALETATRGYRDGTRSANDVVNLQTTRYNAEKLLVTTQFSYLSTLLNLQSLVGTDLEKTYQ